VIADEQRGMIDDPIEARTALVGDASERRQDRREPVHLPLVRRRRDATLESVLEPFVAAITVTRSTLRRKR
jgi:hypothetical protein